MFVLFCGESFKKFRVFSLLTEISKPEETARCIRSIKTCVASECSILCVLCGTICRSVHFERESFVFNESLLNSVETTFSVCKHF
ncbi:hypothetical protein X975_11575, partial [Stegodyphus mimosarum]